MRRKEREITNPNEIKEIIKNANICRIALFDDDFPYIVPMNYGYKDDCLYFHCALEGRKIDLIKKNNKVAFEIEESHELITAKTACQWTTHYRSVMGTGQIEILNNFEEKRDGLDIIMQHHGSMKNQYPEKAIDKVLILKLQIESVSGKEAGKKI